MSARDLGAHAAAHAQDLSRGLALLTAQSARLDAWARHLAAATLAGHRLLVAGNGGSAAEAQHLTAELVGRFEGERVPLSAISLHAETSSLTAIVNDYGAEEMFARQVAAHGRAGDVLLLLSTSGSSPNVVAAARRARGLGITTWAMTGPGPSALSAACDEVLQVHGGSTSAVQELHLVAVHTLCTALDAHVRDAQGGAAEGAADRRGDVRRVTVVGDVLLDRDVDGQVTRLCPDAPVPVVDTLEVRSSPGGAGLTALLCARDAATRLVAPLGTDAAAAELGAALAARLELVPVPQEGGTRRKTRVRSAGQSVVRVDDGGPARPVDVPAAAVAAAVADADVVLVSDYGAGTTHDGALRDALATAARERPVVWDPHPRGGAPVPGSALVTPNLAEARDAAEQLGIAPASDDDPGALAEALREAWQVAAVCVTAGARGAFLAGPEGGAVHVSARAVPGDPCGAGDRFASAAAVALAGGASTREAVERAVLAASAWVADGGADGFRRRGGAVARETAPPPRPGTEPPAEVARRLRAAGGTLVATGGCFDLLHAGHVATLEAAAALGDHLVVLLNGDASVRRLKGAQRPVVGQEDRARVLAALDCVSAVVVFDEDDPRAALDALRPDVWAKGGDYVADELPEADVVRRHGGRVTVLPYVDGRSTTSILDRTGRFAPIRTEGAPA
ncbi:PfkB family carbohydrate kinase [Cellulomonas sp. PhB143]|uniref:PfkB family carbohydrate kinase n=1 Tax=Cellulomonas sp. PhB143 TaxID=2485186 RepID=UPI0013151038